MKTILILHESHGSRLFDISTQEQLEAIALNIVTERFGPKGELVDCLDTEFPEKPDISEEDIPNLKNGSIQTAVEEAWEEYNEEAAIVRIDIETAKLVKEAIQKKDGRIAWKVLNMRIGYEYEGFEVAPCVDPLVKPDKKVLK